MRVFSGTKKVYGCVVDREDHLVRKEGGEFNADEFVAHPERYASVFARQVRAIAFLQRLYCAYFTLLYFTVTHME